MMGGCPAPGKGPRYPEGKMGKTGSLTLQASHSTEKVLVKVSIVG